MKKKYDPLFKLYQIEPDESLSNDQEVVGLMAELLYNMEDITEINKDIEKIGLTHERYLPLIKTMIEALDAELSILGLMGFKIN